MTNEPIPTKVYIKEFMIIQAICQGVLDAVSVLIEAVKECWRIVRL